MISVICSTIRNGFMENVFNNYERQDVKEKELIIILNRDDMDISKWEIRASRSHHVSVYQLPEKTKLGECLNYGIQRAKYGIVAKMDDDDYYGPEYLSQQLKALRSSQADVVCKTKVFLYFEDDENLFLHLPKWRVNKLLSKAGSVKGSTLVFPKKTWETVNFPHKNLGEDNSFLKGCLQQNLKVYTTDQYHYVCLRRQERYHTWKVRNHYLRKESQFICMTTDYKAYADQKI